MSKPRNVVLQVEDISQGELNEEESLKFFLEISGALQKEEVEKVCDFLTKSCKIEFDGNDNTVWLLLSCPELRKFGAIGKPIKDETKRFMRMCFNENENIMKENFMIVLVYLRSLVSVY